MAILAVAGLALRIWFMSGNRGYLDADEAITALTGRWLLHGDVRIVFFGETYGGTVVVLPVALSEAVFGLNRFGVYLPFLVLDAVVSLLVWRVGTRFLSAVGAVFAGLASWLWPAIFVFYGTRAQMFYVTSLVFGLAMVLFTQRAVERRSRYLDWALAGFCAGVGWWQAPSITYFVVPTVIWLIAARHLREAFPDALAAVPAALVGASPWIVFGAMHDFPAFPHVSGANGNYLDHLHYFVVYGLPTALGLRAPYLADWTPGPGHTLLYGAVFVLLVGATIIGLRRGWAWGALALVTFPFLFALIPFGSGLAFGRYVGNIRYQFTLVVILPLAIGMLVRSRAVAVTVLALMLVSTAYGAHRLAELADPNGTGGAPKIDTLRHRLETEQLLGVRAPYWVAWRLVFESGEKIAAIPYDFGAIYGPYARRVAAAHRAAWVFYAGDAADAWIRDRATEGVIAHKERAGAYDIVVIDRPRHTESSRAKATRAHTIADDVGDRFHPSVGNSRSQ